MVNTFLLKQKRSRVVINASLVDTWLHHSLSKRQPAVPPLTTKLALWQLLYWFWVEAFIKTFIWHLLLDCTNLLVSRPGWGCVRKVGKVEGFPQPSALATLGALGPLESHRDLVVTRTAPLSVPEGGSGNRCSDASWCVSPVARKRSNCAKVPTLSLLVALLWQWTHPQWWRHRLAS